MAHASRILPTVEYNRNQPARKTRTGVTTGGPPKAQGGGVHIDVGRCSKMDGRIATWTRLGPLHKPVVTFFHVGYMYYPTLFDGIQAFSQSLGPHGPDMPLAAIQVQPNSLQPKPTLAAERCEYCRL